MNEVSLPEKMSPAALDQRALLDDRTLLAVAGADARSFLDGLLTNQVPSPGSRLGCYAFLLTAQGKYQHDLFLLPQDDGFWLDLPSRQSAALQQKLALYRLRADVTLIPRPDITITACWSASARDSLPAGDFRCLDPLGGPALHDGRSEGLGWRLYQPTPPPATADRAAYRAHCARRGVPDPAEDFISGKSTLMEAGIDGQFGISWTKGCFVGQEPTARTRYRGLVKRLLLPFTVSGGPALAPGDSLNADGQTLGSAQSDQFALVQRAAVQPDGADWSPIALTGPQGQRVRLLRPDWWSRSAAARPAADQRRAQDD